MPTAGAGTRLASDAGTVPRLPRSNTRAIGTLALFMAVQCADAALTAHGIERFGPAIEANPILSFYLGVTGTAATLIAAKSVALCGGGLLYLFGRYAALAVLTVVVVFGAIVPWAFLLG